MSLKSPYYSSLEQEQSTAIDFHHSTSTDIQSSGNAYSGISADTSLAFCDIHYTVSTGWAWARNNKVILNSVR